MPWLGFEGLALAFIFQCHVKSRIISLIIKMVAKSQRLSSTNISAIQSSEYWATESDLCAIGLGSIPGGGQLRAV